MVVVGKHRPVRCRQLQQSWEPRCPDGDRRWLVQGLTICGPPRDGGFLRGLIGRRDPDGRLVQDGSFRGAVTATSEVSEGESQFLLDKVELALDLDCHDRVQVARGVGSEVVSEGADIQAAGETLQGVAFRMAMRFPAELAVLSAGPFRSRPLERLFLLGGELKIQSRV